MIAETNEPKIMSYSGSEAAEFQRIFKRPLKDYWQGRLLGFDILKFDEDFPSGTQSVSAYVRGRFGVEAERLLRRLVCQQ